MQIKDKKDSAATSALKKRAYNFVEQWKKIREEKNYRIQERQHDREFLADFYEVFGVSKTTYRKGFEFQYDRKRLDSLLPGLLLIEMESEGIQLTDNPRVGLEQARDYYRLLQNSEDFEGDAPVYIMTSDFNQIIVEKVSGDNHETWTTTLDDFVNDIDMFSFFAGFEAQIQQKQVKVNKAAAESISNVYKKVLNTGVEGTAASVLMTRIVFALFADDTHIFGKNGVFQELIENSSPDGTDLLPKLIQVFKTFNTPDDKWLGKSRKFRYINGGLFSFDISKYTVDLGLSFDSEVRTALLEAAEMDWREISPVIFGSMFEGALDPNERHDLGAHFTSETNILKVVDSLFMNDLTAEFEEAAAKPVAGGARTKALTALHDKIVKLTFFDPASGSGNFLMVAYRELRRLEHRIIDELWAIRQDEVKQVELAIETDDKQSFIERNIQVEVSQFYGIEIQPYAVSIARVGLWLMDHLMNLEASQLFGAFFVRLPLHDGANIMQGDSLTESWYQFKVRFNYIFGNPPFLGNSELDDEQRSSLNSISKVLEKTGHLDFVAGWFIKAAEYTASFSETKVAFVSTNSIAQGESATNVFKYIIEKKKNRITFAHNTFKWDNSGKNGAAVYVSIIGFEQDTNKRNKTADLFTYADVKGEPEIQHVSVINQYLSSGEIIWINKRSKQISGYPMMTKGSMSTDGGNFNFKPDELVEFLNNEPAAKPYIHPFVGAQEMLHVSTSQRFILYAKDIPLQERVKMPKTKQLVQKVKEYRQASTRPATRKDADTPWDLQFDSYKKTDVLVIPRHTSENREYVPFGYFGADTIVSDAAIQLPNADRFLFGILQSRMHMAWLKIVGGKLEGRYRYANTLVYNTFVIPNVNDNLKKRVEEAANEVLIIRDRYQSIGTDLATLYDTLFMPNDLRKAHNKLDRIVDSIYSAGGFKTDADRVALLMKLFAKNE